MIKFSIDRKTKKEAEMKELKHHSKYKKIVTEKRLAYLTKKSNKE